MVEFGVGLAVEEQPLEQLLFVLACLLGAVQLLLVVFPRLRVPLHVLQLGLHLDVTVLGSREEGE